MTGYIGSFQDRHQQPGRQKSCNRYDKNPGNEESEEIEFRLARDSENTQ